MSAFVEEVSKFRRFSGQLTADELSDAIQELKLLDKVSEHKAKIGCFWMAGGVVTVIGGSFATAALEMAHLTGPIAIAGVAAAIWGVIARMRASKTNFEDRRYELLRQMTQLLRVDMPADAAFELRLDLRAPNHKSKLVNRGKAGHWDVAYFDDSWLQLGGQFLDGTRFSIDMVEKHQDRSRKKRSRSGKTKFKSKTKSAALAVVSLKSKEKRYPQVEALGAQGRGAVQLPPGAQVKGLVAHGNQLTLKALLKRSWQAPEGVGLISQMLLSLYQVLNLSRQIGKSQS